MIFSRNKAIIAHFSEAVPEILWDKSKFFMYFLFMTSVDVYDIDIELELEYYPSRD